MPADVGVLECMEAAQPHQVGRWPCWWPASSAHTAATKGAPAVQRGLSRLALGRVRVYMSFPTIIFNSRVGRRGGCGLRGRVGGTRFFTDPGLSVSVGE